MNGAGEKGADLSNFGKQLLDWIMLGYKQKYLYTNTVPQLEYLVLLG